MNLLLFKFLIRKSVREGLILSRNGSFISRRAHSFTEGLVYFEKGSFFHRRAHLFRTVHGNWVPILGKQAFLRGIKLLLICSIEVNLSL